MSRFQISKWMHDSRVSVLLLALAFLSRMLTQLYFFRTGVDRSLQLLGAKNLLNGHGISFGQVMQENLSTEIYSPIVGWPPGYSIFIAGIGSVTKDLTIAAIIFDLFSVSLLVFFCRKILRLFECPDFLVNMFTLMAGFFLYDFCQVSSPDMSAVAFFICAIYLTLVLLKHERSSVTLIVLIAVMNFIPAFLRYMFVPVSFVIPFYLLSIGIFSRNKKLLADGGWITALTIFMIAAELVFQTNATGAATYVNQSGKGFYPGNLLHFYPVIVAAFINLGFVYAAAADIGIPYGRYNNLVLWLNFILMFTLAFQFLKLVLKKKSSPLNSIQHFIIIGGLASLVILSLLAYMSLVYAPLAKSNYAWTFAQESRYMAFVIVFLQILCFALVFKNWRDTTQGLVRVAGLVLMVLLTIETAHGIYFTSKIATGNLKSFHPDQNYIAQKEYIKELVRGHNADTGRGLVFTSAEKTFVNLAALHGAKVLYGFDPAMPLDPSKDFSLIIIVKNDNRKPLDLLLQSPACKQLKTIGNLSFYEYHFDQ